MMISKKRNRSEFILVVSCDKVGKKPSVKQRKNSGHDVTVVFNSTIHLHEHTKNGIKAIEDNGLFEYRGFVIRLQDMKYVSGIHETNTLSELLHKIDSIHHLQSNQHQIT